MAHHDAMVFGVAAGGDDRAAIAWRVRGGNAALLFVEPRQIVIRKLLERVESDYVPTISCHARVIYPYDDAVEFALILRIDLRPQDVLRCLAIKVPIALRLVLQEWLCDAQQVFDLFRQ